MAVAAPGAFFAVAAAAQDGKPIGELLAVGDITRCGHRAEHLNDEKVAAVVRRALAEAAAARVEARLVLLGDLAYPNGSARQFRDCFQPDWGPLKAVSLPVPGNHEYRSPGAAPYFDDLPRRAEGRRRHAAGVVHRQYRRQLRAAVSDPATGAWLLIALNPYADSEKAPALTGWLDALLTQNEAQGRRGARCVLAFTHPFRFSSGLHGHGDAKFNSRARPRMLTAIAYPYTRSARGTAPMSCSAPTTTISSNSPGRT